MGSLECLRYLTSDLLQCCLMRCLMSSVGRFHVVDVGFFLSLPWTPYPYMASRKSYADIGLRPDWFLWIWGRSGDVVSPGLLWLITRSVYAPSWASPLLRTMGLWDTFWRAAQLLSVPTAPWWRILCAGWFVCWFLAWFFLYTVALRTDTEFYSRLDGYSGEVSLYSSWLGLTSGHPKPDVNPNQEE